MKVGAASLVRGVSGEDIAPHSSFIFMEAGSENDNWSDILDIGLINVPLSAKELC